MKALHTPTPWKINTISPYGVYTNDGLDNVAQTSRAGDAAHIVMCVNSHAELVAACQEALSLFDNYPELYEMIGTFEVLNNALAKVKSC